MSRDDYAILLKEIRDTRLERGYTQAQVAEGIGLSRAQYTALEKGRSLLNWRHLHRLAVFLETTWEIGG